MYWLSVFCPVFCKHNGMVVWMCVAVCIIMAERTPSRLFYALLLMPLMPPNVSQCGSFCLFKMRSQAWSLAMQTAMCVCVCLCVAGGHFYWGYHLYSKACWCNDRAHFLLSFASTMDIARAIAAINVHATPFIPQSSGLCGSVCLCKIRHVEP